MVLKYSTENILGMSDVARSVKGINKAIVNTVKPTSDDSKKENHKLTTLACDCTFQGLRIHYQSPGPLVRPAGLTGIKSYIPRCGWFLPVFNYRRTYIKIKGGDVRLNLVTMAFIELSHNIIHHNECNNQEEKYKYSNMLGEYTLKLFSHTSFTLYN